MRAPLEIQQLRKKACMGCEFSRQPNGKLRGCRVKCCGLAANIRDAKGSCYLGSSEFPEYMHMTPKWGPIK